MTTPSPTPPIDFVQLDALKARLDRHRPLPPDMVANLRADMVLRYTFHSNAIEGNTLTLMETKVVLEDGVTIGGKSMREHLEAINHREAIGFLEEVVQDGRGLDERTLKDLHQLVLRGIIDDAGRYRTRNVIISGAGHTPPDALHVQERMDAFFGWYADAAAHLHPVELAARVHADFVVIHPFTDGNGRTARLLMNLELMRAGFPTVIIPVEQRAAYYENLDAIGVRDDYAPFLGQIGALVAASFEPYWRLLGTAA
jgi:Fic family protein